MAMETIFTLADTTDDNVKLNLDDLYERKKQQDMNTLALYNRILSRVHNKIKTTSRQQTKEQFCWYVMPEMIIGVPKYDHGACTAYVIDKLKENGLVVRYTHPNLLLISWSNWCPSYVRAEIKKKTGVAIDGYGNTLETAEEQSQSVSASSTNDLMLNLNLKSGSVKSGATGVGVGGGKEKEVYKAIDTYKPIGLIYNETLLKTIEDKTKTSLKLNVGPLPGAQQQQQQTPGRKIHFS